MEEKVLDVLADVKEDIVKYDGVNMLEDEILESMEIMDIVVKLEEAFGIEIGPQYIMPQYFMTKESVIQLVRDVTEG